MFLLVRLKDKNGQTWKLRINLLSLLRFNIKAAYLEALSTAVRRSLWNRQIVYSIPCHGNDSVWGQALAWPNLAAIVVPRKSSGRKKNGLESQKTASLSKITLSGMWGDNTNGLSPTGLLRPTDSSSAIRRNYN